MVILAIGIRPATNYFKDIGLKMERGCIITDEYQHTNLPDIYAVGDCAMVKNRITQKKQWSAMGSTANIAGRALALKAEEMIQKFDKEEKLLLVCTRGKRAYLLQNRLRALGYENTRVLEGGVTFNTVKVKKSAKAKLSEADIKRVKGLGCAI